MVEWNNNSPLYRCPPELGFQAGLPRDLMWVFVSEKNVRNMSFEDLQDLSNLQAAGRCIYPSGGGPEGMATWWWPDAIALRSFALVKLLGHSDDDYYQSQQQQQLSSQDGSSEYSSSDGSECSGSCSEGEGYTELPRLDKENTEIARRERKQAEDQYNLRRTLAKLPVNPRHIRR